MIPILETERLVLRGWKVEDFEPLAAFMADADVMKYLSGHPMSRGDAWRSLATTIGHWELRGYGLWAVERKSDSAMIGRIGLLNPEGWPALEVGWTLGKPYWGAGYATEAATAAMRYGFLTQKVERLISCIDPDNKASQAVAARLGETKGPKQQLTVNGETFTVDIWSISREEWEKRNAIDS
jgi:RimJ/RimL family protein N-acetyltransferase